MDPSLVIHKIKDKLVHHLAHWPVEFLVEWLGGRHERHEAQNNFELAKSVAIQFLVAIEEKRYVDSISLCALELAKLMMQEPGVVSHCEGIRAHLVDVTGFDSVEIKHSEVGFKFTGIILHAATPSSTFQIDIHPCRKQLADSRLRIRIDSAGITGESCRNKEEAAHTEGLGIAG